MVSFGAALKSYFVNYFNFSGRSTRAEYWWVILAQWLLQTVSSGLSAIIILPALSTAMLTGAENFNTVFSGASGILFIILVIIQLGLFVPSLSLTFRRLHDVNRSGVWLFVPVLCSLAIFTVPFMPSSLVVVITISSILLSLAASISVLVFLVLPSSPGENKYGSPGDIIKIPTLTTGSGYVYRPAVPPPVFEKPLNEPLQSGRFSSEKPTPKPKISDEAVALPALYQRANVSTEGSHNNSFVLPDLTHVMGDNNKEEDSVIPIENEPVEFPPILPNGFPHEPVEVNVNDEVNEAEEVLPVIPLIEDEDSGDEETVLTVPNTEKTLPQSVDETVVLVASEDPDIEVQSTREPSPPVTPKSHNPTARKPAVSPPPILGKKSGTPPTV